jgi:hypothetical protein
MQDCGAYDPRYRPWYAAAASGPKDVARGIRPNPNTYPSP